MVNDSIHKNKIIRELDPMYQNLKMIFKTF